MLLFKTGLYFHHTKKQSITTFIILLKSGNLYTRNIIRNFDLNSCSINCYNCVLSRSYSGVAPNEYTNSSYSIITLIKYYDRNL